MDRAFTIYRPLKTSLIDQGFGENKACIQVRSALFPVIPIKIVSKTGQVCLPGTVDFYKFVGLIAHNGQDFRAWLGEPIYFPVDSNLTWRAKTEVDKDGGLGVHVISNEMVDQGGHVDYVKFVFWHLSKILVHDGQEVMFGMKVGLAGATGAASGVHLHFAMKPCYDNGDPLYPDNGYTGAVNPRFFFQNEFCLDIANLKTQQLSILDNLKKIVFDLKSRLT